MHEFQQVIFIAMSFVISGSYRYFRIKSCSQCTMSLIGIGFIVTLCREDCLYFFVMTAGAITAIKCFPNKPRYTVAITTIFLVTFHSSLYLNWRYTVEGNVVERLMFLGSIKLIILAYEIFEYRTGQRDNNEPSRCAFGVLTLDREPSVLEIAQYMTCFVGLFTGPIYKFRTYNDMLKMEYYPVKNHLLTKLALVLLFVTMYSVSGLLYDVQYFEGQKILTDSFLKRFFYIYLVGLHHQSKYSFAWLLTECICVFVGLGMYPVEARSNPAQGPTEKFSLNKPSEERKDSSVVHQFDFKTARTLNVMDGYFLPSFSRSILAWNQSVQWWLLHFIYRSTLLPSNRTLRTLWVFFVSALWHGLNPSLFLAILSFAVIKPMDEYCSKYQRDYIKGDKTKRLYLFFHWAFIKFYGVSFIMAAFMMDDYRLVSRLFRLTYFSAFLFPLAVTTICIVAKLIAGRSNHLHSD